MLKNAKENAQTHSNKACFWPLQKMLMSQVCYKVPKIYKQTILNKFHAIFIRKHCFYHIFQYIKKKCCIILVLSLAFLYKLEGHFWCSELSSPPSFRIQGGQHECGGQSPEILVSNIGYWNTSVLCYTNSILYYTIY